MLHILLLQTPKRVAQRMPHACSETNLTSNPRMPIIASLTEFVSKTTRLLRHLPTRCHQRQPTAGRSRTRSDGGFPGRAGQNGARGRSEGLSTRVGTRNWPQSLVRRVEGHTMTGAGKALDGKRHLSSVVCCSSKAHLSVPENGEHSHVVRHVLLRHLHIVLCLQWCGTFRWVREKQGSSRARSLEKTTVAKG